VNHLLNVVLIGLLAGTTTTIGGVIAVLFKPKEKFLVTGLGFSSGVMLGITFLILIPQAMKAGFNICFWGFIVGALFMLFFDFMLPHWHIINNDDKNLSSEKFSLRNVGMMAMIGIAIHDFPEGLALGSGYGVLQVFALPLAVGIALHNIPEGIAISLPLYHSGVSKVRSVLASFATDIPTVLGAVIAYFLGKYISGSFMYSMLSFAGGAMCYITINELIPEAHKYGKGRNVTFGIFAGILLAFLLTLLN
jgi:zinc transporter, ZIP family